MRRKLENQSGMSLVEATIILMVLAILSAVVAPAMGDYLEDSRHTKAKEDVEAIGTAILRLTRDSGFPCLTLDTTPATLTTACTLANRVEALQSGGDSPTVNTNTASTVTDGTLNETGGTYNWPGATAGNGVDTNPNTSDDTNVPVANTDTMDNQLVTNTSGTLYSSVSFTSGGGPRGGLGWRGPYLTGPIDKDPWGFKYMSNTAFLTVASNATAASTEGYTAAGWHRDVMVISAGSDSVVETAFAPTGIAGSGAAPGGGDDVIYVIQGSTR